MKKRVIRLLVILAVFLMFLTFSTPASAHPPLSLDLAYSDGILSVTITHPVSFPDTHYINNVKAWVNGNLEVDEDYTSQPETVNSFTYTYNITAYPGDTIEVEATCSQIGSANETLVVPSGNLPMDVTIVTSSSEVEANRDAGVTITVESDGSGVEDADILLSSDNGGSFSDVQDIGGGEYTSTFTAPEVTTDTTVTITVKVSKAGHSAAEDTVEITVKVSNGGGVGDDDDDGAPGFEAAGLFVGLLAVAFIAAYRKRREK